MLGRVASPKRRQGWQGTLLSLTGWAVVTLLVLGSVARLVAPDGSAPVAAFDAALAIVYLPAWIVAILALIARRRLLSVATMVLVGFQVTVMWPDLHAGARTIPRTAPPAELLRLLDANVDLTNPSMRGYANQIETWRPDLVTMEEVTPGDIAQLRADGALDHLPFVEQGGDGGGLNFMIASRYPLGPARIARAPDGRRPLALVSTMRLPGSALSLWVVHSVPPTYFTDWSGGLRRLGAAVRSAPGRLLMVGDFNATWSNPRFASLLRGGATDAALARGQPLAMTWLAGLPVIPPLLQIDHVLYRGGPQAVSFATVAGPGSDHRELRAVLAVPR